MIYQAGIFVLVYILICCDNKKIKISKTAFILLIKKAELTNLMQNIKF